MTGRYTYEDDDGRQVLVVRTPDGIQEVLTRRAGHVSWGPPLRLVGQQFLAPVPDPPEAA